MAQGTQGVVRGTARVMWLRPHNEAQGKAGMGVRFVRLEPGSARVIEELIAHATSSGSRTQSDGPGARAVSEEPSVILTAERTIGPVNRSSSVPPKTLRAPTLRGMRASDVRSSSPPPAERKSFDSGPPREPTGVPASGQAPDRVEAQPSGTRQPPGDHAGSHGLRERLDRVRRGDETPTASHAVPGTEPRSASQSDRTTAPDGSAINPERAQPAVQNKGLGATMHGTSVVQPSKLSGNTGTRRGSDHALGVPSPPPPPW